MISGKSAAMIRAVVSAGYVTAGGSAAVSLGRETQPLSTMPPGPTRPQCHFLPALTPPLTEERNAFASALPLIKDADRLDSAFSDTSGIPDDEHVDDIGEPRAEDADTTVSSIFNSVKYWAQLFKSFNGMGTTAATGGGVDGQLTEIESVDSDNPSNLVLEGDTYPQKCRFCQSVSSLVPSPINLKNTTLNTVTASRHLFLVRHGQYHNTRKLERDRRLTRVGREQLRLTGERLREMRVSYSRMVASTMKRAQESAEIILKCIGKPDLPFGSDHLLEEGAPIVPEPPLPNWKPNKKQYQTDGERIETAFRKYFRKADISHSSDINEIIVCHANVIRYFVCRALEVQPEAWLRMWLNNGSITWLTIKPCGRVVLNAMGASGYMPPSTLTAT